MSVRPRTGPARSGASVGIKWYRRISVKLALGLGLAMFSIQVLTSQLLIEAYRGSLENFDTQRSAAAPFVDYLRQHLERDAESGWVPTPEATAVVENFLNVDETFLWLDPENRIVRIGKLAQDFASPGEPWPLCDSPEYCGVTLADGRSAGSSWAQLARGGRPIGTFVLLWPENPQVASSLASRQIRLEMAVRFLAAGLVATLTSVLLVSLVTRRLSRLAVHASTPLDESLETVDLPGPFDTAGDDEIARLARALNTMRGRIEDLVARLEERDRQRREWIAQVSHDLRTPLTALTACLDRAQERMRETGRDRTNPSLLEALTVAQQDGLRLQTLVDDLFELARLDANEQLVIEPVPPGELVRQTVRGLRPLAEVRGIELRSVIAPALPTIHADGRRLMRALENMVRNAVHFGRRNVDLVVATEGDYLRFEVRDDGPGLPMVDGKIVFASADDQPRRSDSAGLGLVVTRRVATTHGGTFGAANRAEGGARVWICIPAVVPSDPPTDAP